MTISRRAIVGGTVAVLAGLLLPISSLAQQTPGDYAKFVTNQGAFTVRLFKNEAPKTVANFEGLAEGTKPWKDPKTGQTVKKPFYNGLIFHRVIDGFMIQGGDPEGTGRGGPGYE
ncbi:MAG: peptidylprolyl isomerase, partial [Cyanobacteria bacterium]|nr:peptidylprolyl isomerase [Cyanobacteriota bacterium]